MNVKSVYLLGCFAKSAYFGRYFVSKGTTDGTLQTRNNNSSIVIVSREELLTDHVFRCFQYVERCVDSQ